MPKKILIVDDDPVIVKYLQAVFSDNGYATCNATSSMEGLELVRREMPDLITLDIQMPGEWGPRFYRKLRQDKELREIPVIVISGIDGDHAVKDAVAFVEEAVRPGEAGRHRQEHDRLTPPLLRPLPPSGQPHHHGRSHAGAAVHLDRALRAGRRSVWPSSGRCRCPRSPWC